MYPNLVRVFYLNIGVSETRKDTIVTSVGQIPIEFDVSNLNRTFGALDEGLEL